MDPSDAAKRWSANALAVVLASGLPALLSAGLAGCGASEPAAPRRNVLLVTLDTTRADWLSCYGREGGLTPHLDALARDGVRFARATATAGVTPMSHASILSGLNPYRHGLRVFAGGAGSRLREGVPTLASELRREGWRTGAAVSAFTLHARFGLGRDFEHYDAGATTEDEGGPRGVWLEVPEVPSQRRADATTDAALAWLDSIAGDGEPWFLWVHYFDVHDFNVVPPAEFAARYGVTYDRTVPRTDLDARVAMYELELRFMDQQLERLIERLRTSNAMDETILVVTADHGQGLADGLERHGWARHRILYEWCLNVPLILLVPGIEGGRVVEDLVRTTDIFPTVLDALGVESPPGLDGRSLLPLMRGEPDEPRAAYAEALNAVDERATLKQLPESCRDNLFSATEGKWKLILHGADPERSELFDLSADAEERHNVAEDHPDVRDRLEAGLRSSGALEISASEDTPPETDLDLMNELGYTGDG